MGIIQSILIVASEVAFSFTLESWFCRAFVLLIVGNAIKLFQCYKVAYPRRHITFPQFGPPFSFCGAFRIE